MRNSFNGSAEIAGLASAAVSEDEATIRKFRLFTVAHPGLSAYTGRQKSNFIDKNGLLHCAANAINHKSKGTRFQWPTGACVSAPSCVPWASIPVGGSISTRIACRNSYYEFRFSSSFG